MNIEELPFDRNLTEVELDRVSELSEAQLQEIDFALLSATNKNYRKVAMVVAIAMDAIYKIEGIPDVFYSNRVASLVLKEKLVARGNLKRMRYSEVAIS